MILHLELKSKHKYYVIIKSIDSKRIHHRVCVRALNVKAIHFVSIVRLRHNTKSKNKMKNIWNITSELYHNEAAAARGGAGAFLQRARWIDERVIINKFTGYYAATGGQFIHLHVVVREFIRSGRWRGRRGLEAQAVVRARRRVELEAAVRRRGH